MGFWWFWRRQNASLWTRRLLYMLALLITTAAPAHAALFDGKGTEYVTYVHGTLRLFARQDNTTVTIRRMDGSATQLWTGTIAQTGQMVTRNFSSPDHIFIQADKPITVASGNTGGTDAYGTFVTSRKGERIGRTFDGHTRRELFVYCYIGKTANLPAANIVVTDVTDQGVTNDDSVVLNSSNALFRNTEVEIWYRNNFDNDQIRVQANRDCAVMVGRRIRTSPALDWSVMPPSVTPGEEGRLVGTRFYTFIYRTMVVIPTQDNTTVTITDLSDNDDTRTVILNRKQFFTARPFLGVYNGYTQVSPSPANQFDDDLVQIVSDKPVVVYVGPTRSDTSEHSTFAASVPTGAGGQELFCFVQNGGQQDFQILAGDRNARVTVTTMAGNSGDTSIITRIGGTGNLAWSGAASGPSWWQSSTFRQELVQLSTNQPIWAMCGDFDKASWESYLTPDAPNRPPRITVSGGLIQAVKENDTLTFTVTATDWDNDTLRWTVGALPQGATMTTTGDVRTFRWQPSFTQGGAYTLPVTVTDNGNPVRNTTVTIQINVGEVNRSPTFSTIPSTTVTEGQTYTYEAKASDSDGHTLVYSLVNAPTGAQLDGSTGKLTWTPTDADAKAVTRNFRLRVCDDQTPPACTDQTWSVRVNDVNQSPTLIDPGAQSLEEDKAFTLALKATDPDGDPLTYTMTGLPAGAKLDPNTGKLTWTPTQQDVGEHTVTFTVTDTNNAKSTITVKFTVTDTNDAPQWSSTPPTSAKAGSTYRYTPTATDPDPGDQTKLTFRFGKDAQGNERKPTGASIAPNTGEVTWTPAATDVGKDFDFAIEVCDPQGECTTQSWKVKVAANSAPTISGVPPTEAFVGEKVSYTPTVTDADQGDKHTWRLKKAPTGARIDPNTGEVSWTPTAADTGKEADFDLEVCDDATPPACATQTYKLPVQQKCKVDTDCPQDEVCQGQRCIAPGCYTQTPQCTNNGQHCIEASCKDELCRGGANPKQCAQGEFCRPLDGACIKPCASASCAQGERCLDGICVQDKCAQVTCAAGEICVEGTCEKEQCNANQNPCKHGRICRKDQNACADDPCKEVQCPDASQVCKLGQCVKPPSCTYDADCAGTQLCVKGTCAIAACSADADCNSTQLCLEGKCLRDPCLGVTCAQDQYCRKGTCVQGCAGVFCKAQERCIDGACKADPCANKQCATDELCQNGQCVKTTCTANSCKQGRICTLQGCQRDPCANVKCPSSLRCQNGQCIGQKSCRVDIECPAPGICISGFCNPVGCYQTPCTQGEICLRGICTTNPCDSKQCGPNAICRATDGKCERTCPNCPQGQLCRDGTCQPDPCANVGCPEGQRCKDGACSADLCATPGTQYCRHQRICRDSTCSDDPCAHLQCPKDFTCREGQCLDKNPPQTEQDQEPPADTQAPKDAGGTDSLQDDTSEPTASEAPSETSQTPDTTSQESTTVDRSVGNDPSSSTDDPSAAPGGCGCTTTPSPANTLLWLLLLGLLLLQKPTTKASQSNHTTDITRGA